MVANKVRGDAGDRTVARRAATALAATVVIVVAVIASATVIRRLQTAEFFNPDATPATLTGTAPTAADLDGVWKLDSGNHQLRFVGVDGTYAFDDSDSGTFSVSGNTLTFVAVDSAVCRAGSRWVWQVELLDDGRLHGIVTADECGFPRRDWTWTRVPPDGLTPDNRLYSAP